MKRALTTITAAALLMACEADPKGPSQDTANITPEATTDSTDSASSTDGPGLPGTTDGPDKPGETTEDPDDTTCSFVCDTTSGEDGPPPQCDNWAQDCPDGEKCAAYADNGGSSWNNLKCVPADPAGGQAGDPCTVEGSGVSGFDSCAKGSMCWDIDPDSGQGTCVALCGGSPDAATCADPNTSCVIANEGVLNLCLNKCDPLLQDCEGKDLCLPNPNDPDGFVCVLDASGPGGAAFDPCEYANACDKGLVCQAPSLAMECDPSALGCCLPFCDLSAPECPGAGQQCLAWYEQGTAPPGYENLGLCGIPG
jgi:hypothetical protein